MKTYVLSVSRCLIPALATACLATGALAQQGPPGGLGVSVLNNPLSVFVTNPPNQSTNSFIVNPGDIGGAVGHSLGVGHPVSFSLLLTNTNAGGTPFTVPSNQRLIMEYAGGSCGVNNGAVSAVHFEVDVGPQPSPQRTFYDVAFTPTNALNSSTSNFGHLVRIYADPNSRVFLEADLSTFNGGSVTCHATVSGQLVDLP